MNFFKKLVTFFSAIWNAISWRKNEKKGKQTTEPSEEQPGIAENDSNSTVETEKSFVDVPLHSSRPVCSEVPTDFTSPLVTCDNESPPVAYSGVKIPSETPNIEFGNSACSSLSFFSEPVRVESKPQEPISSQTGNCEAGVEEDAIAKPAEDLINEDSEKAGEEVKPTTVRSPSHDPVSTCLDDPSCCRNVPDSVSNRVPPLEPEGKTPTPGTLHLPRDHITPITTIHDRLNYTAVGDDIHLFHHNGDDVVLDDVTETQRFGTLQLSEVNQNVDQSATAVTAVESAEPEPRIFDTFASSSIGTIPIDVSTASTRILSVGKEHTQESCGAYSTNYMVKSDSLVNFLPESVSELIAGDVRELDGGSLEPANPLSIHDEETSCTVPLLKEGSMEELMCTKKGILQLSGDHLIDCTDDLDITLPNKSNVEKSILNEFLLDDFLLDEPLLKPHHLEGCILDESHGGILPDDPMNFQEISRPNDTNQEDGETVTKLELDAPLGTKIGKGGTTATEVDHDDSEKRNRCREDSYDGNPIDSDGGGNQCPCENTFSITKTLKLDDHDSHVGPATTTDLVPSVITNIRFGNPSAKKSSHLFLSESETKNLFPVMKNDSPHSTHSFFSDIDDSPGFDESWSFSESVRETHQDPASFTFGKKQESPISGIRGKLCHEGLAEESPSSQAVEDLNEFYPFIDCSSFLFRIPEEIRKEASFNPCVGSAPSRRSGFSNSLVESVGFGEDNDGYEKKYTNLTTVPNRAEMVPNINPSLAEEYKSPGLIKLQNVNEYGQQQLLPEGAGTFWGTPPGFVEGDQQHNIADYPVECTENYEAEYMNVVSAAYENDHIRANQSEGYGYVSQYSAVQFPVLGIPYGGTQQSVFLPREPIAPIIFPLHPMNLQQNENPPSLVSLEVPDENEQQYPNLQTFWEGYTANQVQLEMSKEGEKDTSSFGIVRPLGGPSENISQEDNEDDDDTDTMPDSYFHIDENASLHTVRSKADSFSGSLFCESLRSLISHNTDNENVFPSFSCSSVQGYCPSVVVQSCETIPSNDSLPSVIVEETNYSKSVDEDYLATVKFMNDVNTALNESVMDQIQGRVDQHSSLLGRGDGSMTLEPDLGDRSESTENETMSRNSLGENISINNSKLTLLDGVLGTGSSPRLPNLLYSTCGDDSDDVTSDYCRGVLNSLLENIFVHEPGQNATLLPYEAEIEANCPDNQGDSPMQATQEQKVIVQNVVVIEPNHLRSMRDGSSRDLRDDKYENVADELVTQLTDETAEQILNTVGDGNTPGKPPNDGISDKKGRRNKRRRKKSLDAEIVDPSAEVTGVAIGDGNTAIVPEKQRIEEILSSIEDIPSSLLKPDGCAGNIALKPKADGELFPNSITDHSNSEQTAQLDEPTGQDDDEEPDHDEPGESSAASSNNRRRRNRRKKRKN